MPNAPAKDIWDAAKRGLLDDLQAFVSSGVEPDARDRCGRTPLILASYYGNRSVAEWLIGNGANVNAKDAPGPRGEKGSMTSLHAAAEKGQLEIAKLLLEHGAKPNPKMTNGYSPLMLAAESGRVPLVKLLVKHGANVNLGGQDRWMPLHSAVVAHHVGVCHELIGIGANPNAATLPWETTALMMAVEDGHVEMVQTLLEGGADANLHDKWNRTALHHAVIYSVVTTTKSEIVPGKGWQDINGPVKQPRQVVETLLAHGADASATDSEGKTPSAWAKELRSTELLGLLA
jgi:ankyrin repeat protein